MAKGFGTPTNKTLGYVLKLVPELKIYAAAESSFDRFGKKQSDESSAGITNDLSMARVWKSRKQAEKSIQDYLGFLMDWIKNENLTELSFSICALKADQQGNLTTETTQVMLLQKDSK